MLIQLDLGKAYDKISWHYMIKTLEAHPTLDQLDCQPSIHNKLLATNQWSIEQTFLTHEWDQTRWHTIPLLVHFDDGRPQQEHKERNNNWRNNRAQSL